jgi:hypothetical protein
LPLDENVPRIENPNPPRRFFVVDVRFVDDADDEYDDDVCAANPLGDAARWFDAMRAGVFGVATSTGDGGERLEKQKQSQARRGCVCGWVILFLRCMDFTIGAPSRRVPRYAVGFRFLVSFLYRFVSFSRFVDRHRCRYSLSSSLSSSHVIIVHSFELFGDVHVRSVLHVFSDFVDDSHEALHAVANRRLHSVRLAVPSSQGICDAVILEMFFADERKKIVGIQRTAVL